MLITPIIMPRYLSLRTKRRDVHEIEDDNMSITCSISVAQTDDRVLKAGSPRDKQSDRYT